MIQICQHKVNKGLLQFVSIEPIERFFKCLDDVDNTVLPRSFGINEQYETVFRRIHQEVLETGLRLPTYSDAFQQE